MFYFDGFNFYNGFKDKCALHPEWKRYYWLDLVKFSEQFLDHNSTLVQVKYFTSSPQNNGKSARQSVFFNANRCLNGDRFIFIKGVFSGKTVSCLGTCKKDFTVMEEKKTDVAIALEMFIDCMEDKADTLVLVTADSDQVPTIKAIKSKFPNKVVKVYFPPERNCTELFNLCKPIVFLGENENKFKVSLMPTIISKDSKQYYRPDTWR